jgi:hypothetical protein
MNEYYAKTHPVDKGMYRISVSIWKTNSETKIEQVIMYRKFCRYNRARTWAERKITKLVMRERENLFIRDKDIIRRTWND